MAEGAPSQDSLHVFTLFDTSPIRFFDPKFYFTENHSQNYLSRLLALLKEIDEKKVQEGQNLSENHAIQQLTSWDKLQKLKSIPLKIHTTSLRNSIVAIDMIQYLEYLNSLNIDFEECETERGKSRYSVSSSEWIIEAGYCGITLLVPPPSTSIIQHVAKDIEITADEKFMDKFGDYFCCICLCLMKDPVSLPCGHSGCQMCFQNYRKSSRDFQRKCPLCRGVIPDSLGVSVALRSAIEQLRPQIIRSRNLQESMLISETISCPELCQFENSVPNTIDMTDSQLPYNPLHLFPGQLQEVTPASICDSSVRILLRKAGILSEDSETLKHIRCRYENFTETIVEEILWVKHFGNSNLTEGPKLTIFQSQDILKVVKPQHLMVYGYGGVRGINNIWTKDIYTVLKSVHSELEISPNAIAIVHDAVADIFDDIMTAILSNPSSGPQIVDSDIKYRNVRKISDPSNLDSFYAGYGEDTNCAHRIVTTESIKGVLPLVMQGKLYTFALSTLITTLNRLPTEDSQSDHNDLSSYQELTKLGLQLRTTIYLAYHYYGVVLTLPAAVSLTSVCEYLVAEILELSGNDVYSFKVIQSRHVHEKIATDDELSKCFPGFIYHSSPIRPMMMRSESVRNYHELRKLLLTNSPHGVIIDPLTGCHIDSENNSCHHLDMVCAMKSASERAKLAYDLCTFEQQNIIDNCRKELLVNLINMKSAQRYATMPVIPMNNYISFISNVTTICREKIMKNLHPKTTAPLWNIFWTMESLVLLQLSVEKYLLCQLQPLATELRRNW